MKVAISSASFAHLLAAGELTQLEWLEGCASILGADGVVFDRTHFPRTDREYTAQLRKVAIDLGLVPLAIDDPRLLAADRPAAERLVTVELSAGVGAIFLLTVLPAKGPVPPASFVAAVDAAKAAVRAARAAGITVLTSPAPGTLGDDLAALRHFAKDVDSAWLGYLLPAGSERETLRERDRVLVVSVAATDEPAAATQIDEAARPWFLLTGAVDRQRVDAFRRAVASKTLATAAGVP